MKPVSIGKQALMQLCTTVYLFAEEFVVSLAWVERDNVEYSFTTTCRQEQVLEPLSFRSEVQLTNHPNTLHNN